MLDACRIGHRKARGLVLAVLILTTVPAAAATNARSDWKALLGDIGASSKALEQAKARLESRFGYAGSKTTLTAALTAARAPGTPDALAARLYVLWRDVQPFFERHQKQLQAHARALGNQGHALPHDIVWLREAYGKLGAFVQTLERGLDLSVHLTVRRQLANGRAKIADTNLRASRRAMRGTGSRGMVDLLTKAEEAVTNARAGVAATMASLMAHEANVRRDGTASVLPDYIPVTKRSLHRLTRAYFGPTATAPEAPASTLTGARKRLEAKARKIEVALAAAAKGREAARDKKRAFEAAAREGKAHLDTKRHAVDLPEVRALMTRRGNLSTRMQAQRAQIGEQSIDTPEGRREAQRLATAVLALQAKMPAIDAELTRLRSKAYLAGWRKRQREAIAKELASAHVQRQEEARFAQMEAREGILGLEVKGKMTNHALAVHLERTTSLAHAVEAHPSLSRIRVVRPGEHGAVAIMTVERLTAASLIDAVAALQTARAGLTQSVGTLSRAWVLSAAAAKEADSMRWGRAPPELEAALAVVWKSTIKRLAVKGARGAMGRVLRRAFATMPAPSGIAHEAAGVSGRDAVPAGDLALALGEFESTLAAGSTRKLLRKTLTRELRRTLPETTEDDPVVQGAVHQLTVRAWWPFLNLAREAHLLTSARARSAAEHGQAIYEGMDPVAGGKVTVGPPLRVGDPVTVTLQYKGKRGAACPAIGIGPYSIPPRGPAKRSTCRYHLSRLAALPKGDATLNVEPPG